MDELANRFEQNRNHLKGVAFRMLGSLSEAEDAVQEAWIRLARTDTSEVTNLGGWLTTVVARVCLDMLRSRKSRREEPEVPEVPASTDPEQETALADSVGLALLVVLDTLDPAERLAFVLHDMFAVPFDDIASIVGRSPEATRQLASRARRRVQGAPPPANLDEQRSVVGAFLKALRAGDFEGLIAVLDPDVVVRAGGRELRGATTWAKGATQFSQLAGGVELALVDGVPALVFAPRGKLVRVLRLDVENGKIVRGEVITEPERLATLEVSVLD